jgi:hypothetical protein
MQSITDPELVLNGDFEELGDELVTNGTFDTDSDWAKGTGWSIANGKASCDGSQASDTLIYENIGDQSNETIKFSFTVSDYVSGTLKTAVFGASGTTVHSITSNGDYTFYIDVASGHNGNTGFKAEVGFQGSVDNVSIQQVDPNDRWTAQNGWTLQDGLASFGGTVSSYRKLFQENFLTIGNTYELSFEILSISSGSIANFEAGSPSFDTVGVKTQTFVATFDDLYLEPTTDANLTIDNVSVKDITFSTDVDLARINYDSNGENGHWLLEPTSTNLITYSEDFSEWSRTEVSTDKNYTSPDGDLNAVKITDNSVDSTHRVLLLTTTASSGDFTYSVFLKKGTMTDAVLNVYSNGTKAVATIDLENGTITASGGGVNANIENYGNDWYRCSIGGTLASTATTVYLYLSDSKNAYVGNGDFLYMYGAQLEELSYPTSYIPTLTGSTVTRAAETLTGSGNSTLINSTEGVLYAEIAALADDGTNRCIALSDGTADDRVTLVLGDDSNKIRAIVKSNGSTSFDEEYTVTSTLDYHKVAIKYKANDFALWIDGVERFTDTSGSAPIGLNELAFDTGISILNFYGKCKALAVFNEALSDTELTNLTS